MADSKRSMGLTEGYDDEEDSSKDSSSASSSSSCGSSTEKPKPQKKVPYGWAAKVAPGVNLQDLSVEQLQSIIITEKKGHHEDEIRRITDKDHLIRLISHFRHPGQALDGHLPAEDGYELPIESIMCKFDRTERIGDGGFGTVYKGLVHSTPCAIKKTKAIGSSVLKKLLPTLCKEVAILKDNQHPNIVSLLGVCRHQDNLIIVMELMCGNLQKYLKENRTLTPMRKFSICHQVSLGLNWLHCKNILHLDLKMENVLYDQNGAMKLTDFGLSAMIPRDAGFLESRDKTVGNVGHMPPEIIQKRPFNEKADVYSLGVLMWEIMRGHEWEDEIHSQLKSMGIYARKNLREVVKVAVCTRNLRPSMARVDWPERLQNMLIKMWALDAAARPSLSELLARDYELCRSDIATKYIADRVMDLTGRSFWREHFPDYLEKPVAWLVFKKRFYDLLQIPAPEKEVLENDDNLEVRRLLYLKVALNAYKSDTVSLEQFGNVIDAFGPFGEDKFRFLDAIQNTLSNGWFRPDLSQAEARHFLTGQNDGTFIVRFSSKVGVPFTITRVRNTKLHQIRIYRLPNGFRVGEESSRWSNRVFPSLIAIMQDSDIVKAFNLQNFMVIQNISLGLVVTAPFIDTNYENDPDLVLEELLSRQCQIGSPPQNGHGPAGACVTRDDSLMDIGED